ncbi:MAG: universal stress protein [Magnetococcales bacterium]|nr:universal stress protein [Magnetococcales bacterium]MBF0157134.1 universal stress protein [Magnetococcales bacterium]
MNGIRDPRPNGHFRNILLATDGSEYAGGAEALTAAMVLRFGGRVTVMQMALFDPTMEAYAGDAKEQVRIVRESLDKVRDRLDRQGVPCSLMVRQGEHPHQEIIDAAAAIEADLVVMGRRGRRGLARLMLGDSTARVVALSPRPVLVVPRAAGGSLWTSSSILLATDGSPFSEMAGARATMLAKAADVPLRVISVVESKNHGPHFEKAHAAVEQAVGRATEAGVRAQGEVLEGDSPAEVIAGEAHAGKVGLVVGGSHGRTGLGRVFIGSVMERLLGKVHCPVLVVKEG